MPNGSWSRLRILRDPFNLLMTIALGALMAALLLPVAIAASDPGQPFEAPAGPLHTLSVLLAVIATLAALYARRCTRSSPTAEGALRQPLQPHCAAQPIAPMLASLCHDLRTPLTTVIGYCELMQTEVHGPLGHEKYRDYAASVKRGGEEILRLTDGLQLQATGATTS